ncbi:MAG: ankyrin repeat domain-containing protein [Synechococcus sp. SB0678_bin_12]|nr:ankyrin repeat domain-containing protein [Synechococcus sp. SB0678_bin_12]
MLSDPESSAETQGQTPLLVTPRADLNVAGNRGNTPLHLAIRKGDTETFDILIASEADLNIPNNKGNTPLHVAVNKRKGDFSKVLIEAGADLREPLNWASKAGHTGFG